MNARPNPYALTFSDLTRTLVRAVEPSMKERLQAMADAPLTGPRFPSKPSADVLEARSQLRDRLDAELAQDEPNGWSDASEQYEEMPE